MIRNSPCTGKRNTHEKGKEERFNPRFSPSTNPDKLTGHLSPDLSRGGFIEDQRSRYCAARLAI